MVKNKNAARKMNGRPPVKRDEMVEYVRQRIIDGRLAPGAPLPSQQALRRQFRTGADTVQEALRILQSFGFIGARPRSGTFVVPHPPHLSHYALIFPMPESQMEESRFYRAIRDEAGKMESLDCRFTCFFNIGLHVDMADYGYLMSFIKARRLAGAIFAFTPRVLPGHLNLLNEFVSRGMPAVAIALPDAKLACPTVYPAVDNFTTKALQYLTARGHRRIAHLVIAAHSPDEECLPTALVADIKTFGLDCDHSWIQGVSPSAPGWARYVVQLLFKGEPSQRPDALIIHDDNLVAAATQGLVDLGLRVPASGQSAQPGEVEVVALANFPWPSPSVVPVKRLGFDISELVRLGRCLIDQQRQGHACPQATLLPPFFEDDSALINQV